MSVVRRFNVYLLVSAVCMLLMSCGQGGGDSSSPAATVQTIKWQADGNGFVQFLTNDAQYYQYGFWYMPSKSYETQMTTVSATVKKESGSLYSGYGIVFCYQDTNNFYRLVIDAAGHYVVHAKVAGTLTSIIPWSPTYTAQINSGLGAANVISVVQQSPGNFSVLFNGTQETTFSDSNFTGGWAGFYASIAYQAHESFPNTPEDIRFELNSPIVYP